MQQHVEATRHILTTHVTCYDVKTPTFLVALKALQWKLSGGATRVYFGGLWRHLFLLFLSSPLHVLSTLLVICVDVPKR